MTIKDSGERREFATGAVRDMSAGKGRFDLICPLAIAKLAEHMEAGCEKYGERNWEQGIPQHSFADSAERHLNRWKAGETDEDHLVAAFWNIHCAISQRERANRGVLDNSVIDFPVQQPARVTMLTAMEVCAGMEDLPDDFCRGVKCASPECVALLAEATR